MDVERKRPFSLVVLADFSGQPVRPLPKLKERRLVTVTPESYPRLMGAVRPGFSVARGAPSNATEPVDVRFSEPDAFDREAILTRYSTPQDLASTILSSQEYHDLLATWSGLRWLLKAASELANVKVQVWDVSKRELLRDLTQVSEFDQSTVFKRVYEDGLGTFGGDAVGLIVADLFISSAFEDCELLKRLSKVAAAAFSPCLFGVVPAFFTARRWDDLTGRFDPRWFQTCVEYANWRRLASDEHLIPLLPRWRAVAEVEGAGAQQSCGSVWLNPSYLVAAKIARAMNASEVLEIAANLFPNWHGVASTAESCLSDSGVVLEWEADQPTRAGLGEIGFNALSASGIQRADAFETATTASCGQRESIAACLLKGFIRRRIYQHARWAKRGDNADHLIRAVELWAATNIPSDSAGRPLLTLGQVENEPHARSILWHAAVGGDSDRIAFGVQPARSSDSPPSRATPIVVLGELGTSESGDCEPVARVWNSGNDDLPFRRSLAIEAPDQLTGSGTLMATLALRTWRDLEPDAMWIVPRLKQLDADYWTLGELGFYAHIGPLRSRTLAEFASRPGALEALLVRLQGWCCLVQDPEHSAIDPQTVEGSLGDWGLVDRSRGRLEHVLNACREYLARLDESSGLSCVDQFRHYLENIDRLLWLQVREMYRAPAFRHHERLCFAVKWMAEQVHESGKVFAFGYNEGCGHRLRCCLEQCRTSDTEAFVVVASAVYPEVLDAVESFAILHPDAQPIIVAPLDMPNSPAVVEDLPPDIRNVVVSPKTATLILAMGNFLLKPARLVEDRPFSTCLGEIIEDDLSVSTNCQVAAAVARTASRVGQCDASTLEPALRDFGLTCRPLGQAVVVTKAP